MGHRGLLRFATVGKRQLVRLVRRSVLRGAGIPWWNRRLAGRVERFHRLPHLVHAVGEEIADEEVGDRALELGVAPHELSEAETVVVLAYQPAHAIDAAVERRPPFAELFA